jgi:NTE family protein
MAVIVNDASPVSSLLASPIFQSLDPSHLEEFTQSMEESTLLAGEYLFREGDPGDALYLLVSGRLAIEQSEVDTKTPKMCREVGRGTTVGELSLLTGNPRSASVRALRDSHLLKISKSAFEVLCEKHPRGIMHLAKEIAHRFTKAEYEDYERGRCRCIALMMTSKNPLLKHVAYELHSVLGGPIHARFLTSDDIHRTFGTSAPQGLKGEANTKLARWLDDQEREHPFVILIADEEHTTWTQRCMRQADRILVFALAHESPAEPVSFTVHDRAKVELVLINAGDQEFSCEAWKDFLQPIRVHHIGIRLRDDVTRLGRHLIGKTHGLVLGGGGARGFAHIGAIRAIREAGIPIDAVGGSSMGGVIAAQCALGMDYQALLQVNRECWIENNPLRDYTFPLLSLNTGAKMCSNLKQMFGERTISDLLLPYFCVSSNLTRSSVSVHSEGLVWRAVRASLSIPGIAPPLVMNNEMHVDGGVLNNLPIDVMKQSFYGPVIGVEVSTTLKTSSYDDADVISGWALAWQRLRKRRHTQPQPTIFDVLLGSSMLSSRQAAQENKSLADLALSIPVQTFGLFEWKALAQIAEIGYRHTITALEAFERKGTVFNLQN